MNPRARKKEPPDLLLPLFALPIASHLLDDLAIPLLLNRFPLPAILFPCPSLDFSLSSVASFYQFGSPPQVLGVCGGIPGSTRSGGPRLAIDGCGCQDRCFCSESRASFCQASLRPAQFASFPCSNCVFSSSAVADSSQICCPSQLVAKVRRQIRWSTPGGVRQQPSYSVSSRRIVHCPFCSLRYVPTPLYSCFCTNG